MKPKKMMETGQVSCVESERAISLRGGQSLVLDRATHFDLLRIIGTDGQVSLSIEIAESGPILRFQGGSLAIQTTGDLAIEADHLTLHGRNGVSLISEGDVSFKTTRHLHTEAMECQITATLGNVNVRANDDVKLNGERVMVNC